VGTGPENAGDYTKSTNARKFVFALLLVSIVFNGVSLLIVGLHQFRSTALSGNRRATPRATSLTKELVKRLAVYPLFQAVTQVWTIWGEYDYRSKAAKSTFANGSQSDDEFYKQPYYLWCWALQFVLSPSAGIWFAVAFISLSRDARQRLLLRIQCLQFSYRGPRTTRDSLAVLFRLKSRRDGVSGIHSTPTLSCDDAPGAQPEVSHAEVSNPIVSDPQPASRSENTQRPNGPEDAISPSLPRLQDLDEQQLTDLIDQEAGFELPAEERSPRARTIRGSVLELAETYGRVLELATKFGGAARISAPRTENPMMIPRQLEQNMASDDIPQPRRLQPGSDAPAPPIANIVPLSSRPRPTEPDPSPPAGVKS